MTASELARGVLEASSGSRDFVNYSCALASLAFSRNRKVAAEATRVVFSDVVQPLAERFDSTSSHAHAAFMAEVVHAPGSPISGTLRELGFASPAGLVERYRELESGFIPEHLLGDEVTQAVVLSRVEIKEDFAVTSTVLRCARSAFRKAEIDFIAPRKNAYLFAGPHTFNRRIVSYSLTSPLANRLLAWKRVRRAVQASIQDVVPEERVVVDPDSCMTLHGLLPIGDDSPIHYFPSRSYAEGKPSRIADLAADWCGQWFFWGGVDARPYVVDASGSASRGFTLAYSLRKKLAGVSFTVNGRESARLGRDFEDALLDLLRRRGYWTVLDSGRDESDAAVVAERVRAFRGTRKELAVKEDGRRDHAQLMTCKGNLRDFAGWVSRGFVYIGYDSVASHVVASLGMRVAYVSAGAPNGTYQARWTPVTPGAGLDEVDLIPADGPDDGPVVLERIEAVLDEIDKDNLWSSPDIGTSED